MVLHAKLEILELVNRNDVEWVPNVQMFGCEGNEDMVGKLSRLSRRVNSRLASRRALELYLMKCKAVHRRFRKSQPKQGNKPSWVPGQNKSKALARSRGGDCVLAAYELVLMMCDCNGSEDDEDGDDDGADADDEDDQDKV